MISRHLFDPISKSSVEPNMHEIPISSSVWDVDLPSSLGMVCGSGSIPSEESGRTVDPNTYNEPHACGLRAEKRHRS